MDNTEIINFKNNGITIYFCRCYEHESGHVAVMHKTERFYMIYEYPIYGALPLIFKNMEVFNKFKENLDPYDINFLKNPDVELLISDSEKKVLKHGDECYFVDYTLPLRGKKEEK